MRTIPTPSAPLLPTLPDAFDKRVAHDFTTLRGGDQLHTTAAVFDFASKAKLPVYGYCTQVDAQGQPCCVRAYVRATSATSPHAISFADRDAARFPMSGQVEQWFGAYLLYLVEIDLTEYADCLKLERQPEAVSMLLTPTTTLRLAA